MKTEVCISYDEVIRLLAPYFQQQYPDCKVKFYCKHDIKSYPDGFGFTDDYNVFSGYLEYSRNTVAFGKVTLLSDTKRLSDKEIRDPLSDILNNMLDNEGNNLKVSYIDAGEHCITINIDEKRKSIKKIK